MAGSQTPRIRVTGCLGPAVGKSFFDRFMNPGVAQPIRAETSHPRASFAICVFFIVAPALCISVDGTPQVSSGIVRRRTAYPRRAVVLRFLCGPGGAIRPALLRLR